MDLYLRERRKDDLATRVKELRAEGAIVENYYRVMDENPAPPPSPPSVALYSVASLLVAGGCALMILARRTPGS